MHLLNSLKYRVINLLPWHDCKLCGIPCQQLICDDCVESLDNLDETDLSFPRAMYFDNLSCKFVYSKPLSKILQQFKYNKHTEYTYALGYLLYQALGHLVPDLLRCAAQPQNVGSESPHLIIPMPLHKARQKERGFNQAEYLLHYYQIQDNRIKVANNIIKRTKNTPQQALMSAQDRQHNLDNAFTLSQSVSGKHIILVDDVITTGSSANEVAKLLKANGAIAVDICCLARAV